MSIETIQSGKGLPAPVKDKSIATVVSETARAVDSTFGTDFKNKTGQTARSQCSTLHKYSMEHSAHPSIDWDGTIAQEIRKAGKQIQSGQYTSAQVTLDRIRVRIYAK